MSARSEIEGLAEFLEYMAEAIEEAAELEVPSEPSSIYQATAAKLREISEAIYTGLESDIANSNQKLGCERCSDTGKIFDCPNWPGCKCPAGTVAGDCPGETNICPVCIGRAASSVQQTRLLLPEEVWQRIDKARRGEPL